MTERGDTPERAYARALRLAADYRQRQAAGAAESPAEFLAAHRELREILEPLLADAGAVDDVAEPHETARPAALPERVGPYRILTLIGEGGMGEVYLAEQDEPVRRRVALKVIKLGMDTGQVLARFEAERQALAMMNHANIAKVLDAGATDGGRPYFVMELVKGLPITEYCDKHRLSIADRILLFQQVCRGVQHAHHKGVMHRDLKPSNILVAMQDGEPIAKIIDFGLARAMEHRLTERTLFTETGQIVGTPEYMSPEQAEMQAIDVDTRTDIYSLGVLLYELLTGQLPFAAAELRQAGYLEIQRRIREDEPPKPSTRVSTLGAGSDPSARARATTVVALCRELRGDLDWIVMKALEKDRVRRYQTPTELALDLSCFLEHEPVSAGPPGTAYRLAKFVRRYRREVLAGGAAATALVVGLVVSIVQYLDAREQQSRAVTAKTEAERLRGEAERSLANFDRVARLVRFDKLMLDEAALWPEAPAKVEAMQRWIADAEHQAAELPAHRITLDALRARARASEPVQFDDDRDQYLHDGLVRLIAGLEELATPDRGTIARVRRRLEFAERVEVLSIENRAEEWSAAIEAIARHPKYAGLELKPQLGLVPLEPDPVTGLWEFAHLRSGERPQRDAATGRWRIGDKTGLVFVLLPGGEFEMGAQRGKPSEPNYDPGAFSNEAPTRTMRVTPLFVSKYELTQGQWLQLADLDPARNPAYWRPGGSGPPDLELNHPIEQVSWQACHDLLMHHGLDMPTEAEWEYACRAGSTTPYWFGNRESLGKDLPCNIADDSAFQGEIGVEHLLGHDDGAFVTAPVGSYPANPFGLHDVHGNVFEWCKNPGGSQIARGGSFFRSARDARSSRRYMQSSQSAFFDFGVRPVRRID